MKILVDTSVWSVALRKSGVRDKAVIAELGELIREMRIVMIGPIRQELLSGISDEDTYVRLRESIRAFDDLPSVPTVTSSRPFFQIRAENTAYRVPIRIF